MTAPAAPAAALTVPLMATDGPMPPPCDNEIFEHGHVLMVCNGIPSCAMEEWVKAIAAISGERVDWHFSAGRAIVKYIGDIDKINPVKVALMPLLEYIARRESEHRISLSRADNGPLTTPAEEAR